MPRICIACVSPDRSAIDQALVNGTSLRNIAKQYFVSVAGLHRHRAHLAEHIVTAKSAESAGNAETLLERVHVLLDNAQRLTAAAEAAKDLRTALSGIGQIRGILQLLGEVSGQLSRAGSIDLNFTFSSTQDAKEKLQNLVEKKGLPLLITEPISLDPAENERRIAQLLAKAGMEPWVPKRNTLTIADIDAMVDDPQADTYTARREREKDEARFR